MKKYQCNKTVKAKPMTRQEYNDYRGWVVPENENPLDEGYLVEYLDGGQPNHTDHEGYISWSPKDVFEKGYAPIETFEDRMELELAELAGKIAKLGAFIETSTVFADLSEKEQSLLRKQYDCMYNYASAIATRMGDSGVDNPMPRHKISYDFIKSKFDTIQYQCMRIRGTTETQCTAVLPNGFVIGRGTSGCVNPDDFNQALGEKYAKERAEADAINNLWHMEGYAVAAGYTNG